MVNEAENFHQDNSLNQDDIEKLLQSPLEKRMDITKKIAELYTDGAFDKKQMDIAQNLFQSLVKDTEVEMRKTLVNAIKDIPDLPKDMLIELAKDVQDVAIPILEFSKVLGDNDLIEIIETTQDLSKQLAITRRKEISEKVSTALVNTENDNIVSSLLSNHDAKLSDGSYKNIIDMFEGKDDIMGKIVNRESLPINIVEKLADIISSDLLEQLSSKHKDAYAKISDAVKKSREATTMKIMGMKNSEKDYHEFCQVMKKLRIAEELTPITALCMGNINIFEISVARKTKASVMNIRTLLYDKTNKGFRAIYTRSNLPMNIYEATELLVEILRDAGENIEMNGIRASQKSMSMILQSYVERSGERGYTENIEYITNLIKENISPS